VSSQIQDVWPQHIMATNQPNHPVPYPRGVPRGLVNEGYNCYLNSAIQILFHVETIRNLFLRNVRQPPYGQDTDGKFCKSL
jgi:ubiquitin C-terminal hydrolase